ncbi:MAG TPA: DinB family protein [Candidatus Sulfomarinibacteraceae bacterium]|nr:DinB family protein [Candidatus Sulfomarinibacteraceae bacterium]
MSGERVVPDRSAIVADLERGRREFHQLAQTVNQRDWFYRDLTISDFSIGELLAHTQRNLALAPSQVEAARHERSLWRLPHWAFNPLRLLGARWSAWRSSPQNITEKYDEAHAALLRKLETIKDDEWQHGAYFYDQGYWTVAFIFRHQSEHVAEHAATVRRLLASKRARRFGYS